MNYGVDRYKRPHPISAHDEELRQTERAEYLQKQVNDLWRTIPKTAGGKAEKNASRFPSEPQENILYFLEKNSPLLEPWQREVIRIVRKIAQYANITNAMGNMATPAKAGLPSSAANTVTPKTVSMKMPIQAKP